MAENTEPHSRKTFNFKTFTIHKQTTLGIGSYGAVYKASCDQLPCAAKILHPTIVDTQDPGSGKIMERFQQECSFLSHIRHPNIVQYLGLATDRESKLPVLLMELIDESLTSMLERKQNPLPFHTQVDLNHDIALAISYLHSNGILHRDLSSNNVLIIAKSRAKVTDFGMSKLSTQNVPLTPMTLCPGTMAYMSPEAFREPPVYTEKLDCFSIGVLMIQISTRLFPDPGPRSQPVVFAQSPTGFMDVPITDDVRRKSHLDLISQTHPCLPVTLRCLKHKQKERPSAVQLCQELADIKVGEEYRASKERSTERASCEEAKETIVNLEDQLSQTAEKLEASVCEVSKKTSTIRQLHEEQNEMIMEIRHRDDQLKRRDHTIEDKMEANISEIRALRQEKTKLSQDLRTKTQELALNTQLLTQKEREIETLNKQLSEREDVVSKLKRSLKESDDTVHRLQKQSEDLEQQLKYQSPMTPKRSLSRQESQTVKMTSIAITWEPQTQAPMRMSRGTSVASKCGTAYFNDASSQIIQRYSSDTKAWCSLPKCPHYDFSLAIINNMLTAIGGSQISNYQLTNKLLSFMGDGGRCGSWIEFYPPMPTKRCFTAAAQTSTHLIVIGGSRSLAVKDSLDTVEVMDDSMQWWVVTRLPCKLSNMTATVCNDRLFLLGGNDESGKTKLVLTCSLPELLKSNTSKASKKDGTSTRAVDWRKTSDLPSFYFSAVTVSDHLLAIGGWESQFNFAYNPISNAWEKIERKIVPRYLSHVVTLPNDQVMVVGGNTGPLISTSSVEIGRADIIREEYLYLLS